MSSLIVLLVINRSSIELLTKQKEIKMKKYLINFVVFIAAISAHAERVVYSDGQAATVKINDTKYELSSGKNEKVIRTLISSTYKPGDKVVFVKENYKLDRKGQKVKQFTSEVLGYGLVSEATEAVTVLEPIFNRKDQLTGFSEKQVKNSNEFITIKHNLGDKISRDVIVKKEL